MTKFWNFVCFQLGWFACVIGAAHDHVFWPAAGTLFYVALHIWRASSPTAELRLVFKAVIFGVSTDTLIANFGFLSFEDAWPSMFLSPFWMWVLWALVASTINSSLSWLQGRPILAAALGGIAGPMSYEAGIRMGAGAWGVHGQVGGLLVLGLAWGIAIPLLMHWNQTGVGRNALKISKKV
jgi:hypothetical protein